MPDDAYDVIMKIHVRAPFRLVRAAAPYFRIKVSRLHRSIGIARAILYLPWPAERDAGKSFHYQRFLHLWPPWKCRPDKLCRRQVRSGRNHEDNRERVGSIWCSREHRRVRLRSYKVPFFQWDAGECVY